MSTETIPDWLRNQNKWLKSEGYSVSGYESRAIEIEKALERITELEKTLSLISERAVCVWDGQTVGDINACKIPNTYGDWLKMVFLSLDSLKGKDATLPNMR